MADGTEFIDKVRQEITAFKISELQSSIEEDQDTEKLNGYLKITSLAYEMLKRYVDTNGASQLDPLLRRIGIVLRNGKGLTQEEKMLVKEYLFRDLIEYPFTYNSVLINSFDKSEVFNTNIIPNK
jgi:hypothetical protein